MAPSGRIATAHSGRIEKIGIHSQVQGSSITSLVVSAFLVALVIPIILNFGPFRFSVYRMVLVAAFIPSLWMLVSGMAGRFRLADAFAMLLPLWILVSDLVYNGASAFEPSTVLALETLGAYLLARVLVTGPTAFKTMVKVLFGICLVLGPFAIYEALTGTNIVMQFWGSIGRTLPDVRMQPRLGLDRAQGPFDHPIHFGVFFTPLIGLTYFVLGFGKPFLYRLALVGIVFGVGFLALSSGPISAFAVQLGLILWFNLFKKLPGHWWFLLAGIVLAYVVVAALSERTPIEVAISYLALNPVTGYGRTIIWEFGWINIWDNPVFGIGRGNEWVRHPWMSPSFDMFWLVFPMTYGLVALVAHAGCYFAILFPAMSRRIVDDRIRSYRLGWATGTIGFAFAGWMVHFWNAPLVLHFFILGSGVWLLDKRWTVEPAENDTEEKEAGPMQSPAVPRYTRFPHRVDPEDPGIGHLHQLERR